MREGLVVLVAVVLAGALVWGATGLGDEPSDQSGTAADPADSSDPGASGVPASGWAPPTLVVPDDGIVDVAAPTSEALTTATLDLLVESAPVVVTTSSLDGPEASAADDLARSMGVPLLLAAVEGAAPTSAEPSTTPRPSEDPAGAGPSASPWSSPPAPAVGDLLETWSTEHVVAVGTPPETSATVHQVTVEVPEASPLPTEDASAAPTGADAEPVVTRPEQVDAMIADATGMRDESRGSVAVLVRTPPSEESSAPEEEASEAATSPEESPTVDEAASPTESESEAPTEGSSASPTPTAPDTDFSVVPMDLQTSLEVLAIHMLGWGGDDPRADELLGDNLGQFDSVLLAVADDQFPDVLPGSTVAPDWPSLFTAAVQAPELVGGGRTLFPDKTFIATYGNPSGPALGVLGERDVDGSIAFTEDLVDDYEGLFGDSQVQPAFELISTIASAEAGDDGNYSRFEDLDLVTEWVDAANEAGVYVVLDLQPGRTDFLTQAQQFEELLRRPNVGLALDPEWRLAPDEVHLQQIGTVTTEEVNEVADWLAGLVRDEVLPQKLLIVHNFRLSMLTDREDLRLHPELATMVHVDGQGAQHLKDETYAAITGAGPDELWWGWKNFYDEDSPEIRSPEDTAAVEPTPHFISYQ